MLDHLRPLFVCLNRESVDYVVIGGVAAIAYGVPRLTLDIDILIRATPENVDAMLRAFTAAGLGTASLTNSQQILANEITIFKDRVRVDVQTRTPGLAFDDAFEHRNVIDLEGTPVFLTSLEDLIASKKASGRPRDPEDVATLERARPRL